MNVQTFSRVADVLSKVTGKKVDNFDLSGDLRNELSLDSIQIVEFFAALELEFQCELPLELMTAKTGQEFMEKLQEILSDLAA